MVYLYYVLNILYLQNLQILGIYSEKEKNNFAN